MSKAKIKWNGEFVELPIGCESSVSGNLRTATECGEIRSWFRASAITGIDPIPDSWSQNTGVKDGSVCMIGHDQGTSRCLMSAKDLLNQLAEGNPDVGK